MALAVVDTTADIAKGVQKTANRLSAGLRQGKRFAGKYLPLAGRVAQKLEPLAKASIPITLAVLTVDVARGKNPGRAAAKAIGGVVGASIGAFACTSAGTGVGAVVCVVAVAAGAKVGETVMARAYDAVTSIGKSKPKSSANRRRT